MGSTSNKLIGLAGVISMLTITGADLSGQGKFDTGGLSSSREWIGVAVVFLMLSAAADLGFEAAGGMAVLVMIAVLLARGEDAAAYVGIRLNTRSPAGSIFSKKLRPLKQQGQVQTITPAQARAMAQGIRQQQHH